MPTTAVQQKSTWILFMFDCIQNQKIAKFHIVNSQAINTISSREAYNGA